MVRTIKTAAFAIAIVFAAVASGQAQRSQVAVENGVLASPNGNVLLAEWTGPYGGVPAFDRMDLAALKPALEAGMAATLAEIDTIAESPDPPTFDNTVVALERTGRDLERVMTYRSIWANLSSPEFREIQLEMAPRGAAIVDNRFAPALQREQHYAQLLLTFHKARQELIPV